MHRLAPLPLTILALTLPVGAALAQGTSTVELFGRMDVGLASFKGIEGKPTTTVTSGISAGSALGVRGEEDLGQGYKAVFVLEHGLYADDGGATQGLPLSGIRIPAYATAGVPDEGLKAALNEQLGQYMVSQTAQPFWGRQALVGLITPYGAVLGGRSYSPAYEVFDFYDPMESGNVADPYALLAVPIGLEVRINKSLQYRIEAQGWTGSVSWSGALPAGGPATGRFYGMQLRYENSDFSLGVAHQERQNSLGESALVNNVVGAWWKLDAFKLMGSYTTARDRHSQAGLILKAAINDVDLAPIIDEVANQLNVDSKVLSLGVQYQATPALRLIANHAQLRDGKLAQGDATLWGAAAEYALSKRTSIWTGWSQINNQAEQQVAPITSGTLTGFAATPGQNTSALQLNVSHKF
jgi:predicted porin